MNEAPLVSIIVINYKNYKLTRQCLKSLQDTTYPNFEIILVDNVSDEKKLAKLNIEFNSVKFFPSDKNLYYAGGNNLGLTKSSGELIVFLNNDTEVKPDWLGYLVNEAKKEPYKLYQPKILLIDENEIPSNENKRLFSMGNALNTFGFAYPIGLGMMDLDVNHINKKIFYPSGTCFLVSKKLIEVLGYFDSNFFTYYEDVNFGWRSLLQGYETKYVPKSIIFHKWGASFGQSLSPRKFLLLERGRWSTLIRNLSLRSLILMLPSLFLIELIMYCYSIMNGLLIPKVKANFEVISNLSMIIFERKNIQKSRRVSDQQIFKMMSFTIEHPYIQKNLKQLNFVLKTLSKICTKFI